MQQKTARKCYSPANPGTTFSPPVRATYQKHLENDDFDAAQPPGLSKMGQSIAGLANGSCPAV
jgi:hypothetical protein